MDTNKKELLVLEKNQTAEDTNELLVVFSKPYTFEQKIYENIDLSGLNDLTARDMIDVNKIIERSGSVNVLPEMSVEYACLIASKASDLPVEFFYGLPPKDTLKLKNRVTGFFFGEE